MQTTHSIDSKLENLTRLLDIGGEEHQTDRLFRVAEYMCTPSSLAKAFIGAISEEINSSIEGDTTPPEEFERHLNEATALFENEKTEEELQDEFHSLRNDDPDFAEQYDDHEFEAWKTDQVTSL